MLMCIHISTSISVFILLLSASLHTAHSSVIDHKGQGSKNNGQLPLEPIVQTTVSPAQTWSAESLPNPQECPSCCGLDNKGWICDPDNILVKPKEGGFTSALNVLNGLLELLANKSVCPCIDCGVRNTTLTVYVVNKINNSNNLPPENLITKFSDDILMSQRDLPSYESPTCRPHIVMVMAFEESLLHMSLGESVNRSGLMTYDDVDLIWNTLKLFNFDKNIYLMLDMIIKTVTKYTETHPKIVDYFYEKENDAKSGMNAGSITLLVVLYAAGVNLGIR